MSRFLNEFKTACGLKLLLFLGVVLVSFSLSRQRQIGQKQQVRVRLGAIAQSMQIRTAKVCANLANQSSPGAQADHLLRGDGCLIHSQGEIVKAQACTDLSLSGNGYFALLDGKKLLLTRDGRFRFFNGILCSQDGRALLGYPVASESGPAKPDALAEGIKLAGQGRYEQMKIHLELEPTTKLYAGKYTGFHFDETGTLYAESVMTDPVTGQSATSNTALYQLAIALPRDLDALRLASCDVTTEPGLRIGESRGQRISQRVTAMVIDEPAVNLLWGSAGDGCSVCPGSLELTGAGGLLHQADLGVAFGRYGALFSDFASKSERDFLHLSYYRASDVFRSGSWIKP